jgi:hypothetical protein
MAIVDGQGHVPEEEADRAGNAVAAALLVVDMPIPVPPAQAAPTHPTRCLRCNGPAVLVARLPDGWIGNQYELVRCGRCGPQDRMTNSTAKPVALAEPRRRRRSMD